MLKTLSPEEHVAVGVYDRYVRDGDIDHTPLWADHFTNTVYASLTPNAPLIDIGCGTGRFINLLPSFRITNYIGVDPSEESITYCNRTFPNHSFAVGEIRTVGEEYPDQFLGFALITVLMHIPRRALTTAVSSLRGCLQVGATGFISTPLPRHKGEKTWKNLQGMKLTLHTSEEIRKAFSDNGFIVQEMFTPDGNMLLAHMIAI